MKKETIGIIYKIFNIFCIVLIGLVNKGIMKDLSVFQTFFLSCLANFILLSAIIKFQQKQTLTNVIKELNKDFFLIAIISFLSFCTFLYALQLIDMNIVTAIMYLIPIIVSLLAIFILGEKFSLKIGLALAMSIVGAVVIMKSLAITSIAALGVIMAFSSTIGWALHDFLLKYQAAKIHWAKQNFMILVVCIPLSLPLAIITWQPLSYSHIKFILLLGILYTANKMCLIKALANTRLILLAPISYTKMIFTAIATYLLFNEVLTLNIIIGSTLIIAATIIILSSTKNILSASSKKIIARTGGSGRS